MTTKKNKKPTKTPARPLLEAKTWREGRTVCMQITHQDERLRRAPGEPLLRLTPPNFKGLVVWSGSFPELRDSAVYVRGNDRSRDNDVVRMTFASEAKAIDYHRRLNAALRAVRLPKRAKAKPAPKPALPCFTLVASKATA